MSLVTAILKEIESQVPHAPMLPPRVVNQICRCADKIVAEAAVDFRGAKEGIGLDAWLKSDDTGMSSRFMAYVCYGAPPVALNYPHDGDDFGRCRLLIIACGRPSEEGINELNKYPEWADSIAKLKAEFHL